MRNTFYIFIFCLYFLPALQVNAQSTHYILALSKSDKQLIVMDYYSLKEIARIPTGPDPHEIVSNDDGSIIYVSNPELKNNGHQIDVINLDTFSHIQSIDTQPFYIPHGLAYLNNQLWFTAQAAKVVGVYDINTKKVIEVFGTGQDFTHLLEVLPDGKTFYTTNVESGTMSIYEKKVIPPYMPPTGHLPPDAQPRLEWRQTLIHVGYGAEGFDISPNQKELWTARPDGHVIIVDTERKKITNDINTGVLGLHRLKITANGEIACIVSVKTGDLLFYDVINKTLLHRMKVGQGAGLFIDDASNRLFISCTPNNYISVIDLSTYKELTRIEIGRPDGVTAVDIR